MLRLKILSVARLFVKKAVLNVTEKFGATNTTN